MAVSPIPTTRVSDQLVRRRLLNQLTSDQISLVRLQTQISTGRRIILPSEDAPAALRAMALQNLIERKQQVQTNLQTSQSYLSATDSALANVSELLSSVRGTALGVIDVASSDAQRAAAAQEVDRAIQQLVDAGNQRFRGRYLFAGSRTTVQPFTNDGQFVQYHGNQGQLESFADIDLTFASNVDGHRVFGAISTVVVGSVDLAPTLSASTRLADLNGGEGVGRGSLSISDGTNTSIVDLSAAETLGDVVGLLEANPPLGRKLSVSITSTGLSISLDAAGAGNLRIAEVGSGTTAAQLGILAENFIGTGPLTGGDLDPRVTGTTQLRDILGTKARAAVGFPGSNNNLVFDAVHNGPAFNNVTVSFVDNPAIAAGNETVAYDNSNPAAPTLTFQIDAGNTEARNILAALNNNPVAGAIFRASLVSSDQQSDALAGTGLIDATATGVSSGGTGVELDQAAGLRIVNAGATHDIDISSAETVEDLLNLLNGSGAAILAEINASGTGLNLRSRASGADFAIGELGGQSATQLGLRSFTTASRLEDLNHGLGVHQVEGVDFSIRRTNGLAIDIDLDTAATIGDAIDLINANPNNGGAVTAQLSAQGNGIELVTNEVGADTFAVLRRNFSQAGQDLGLIPVGADQSGPASVSGATQTITGRDTNPREVVGTFNALVRLRDALTSNNLLEANRSIAQLDQANVDLNLSRAEVGARQQGLDVLRDRLDTEVITLKDSLSNEIDTDFAQAVSDLAARQAALQASLQTTAAISKLSLLDFL